MTRKLRTGIAVGHENGINKFKFSSVKSISIVGLFAGESGEAHPGEKIMKAWKMFVTGLLFLGSLMLVGESFAATTPGAVQTVGGGGVMAKVTFLNPKGADDARFRVVLDTHSVNLDAYDFKNIAVLRDDAGKSYVPIAVENKGSGHHREAIVSFPNIAPETKRIELIIKDVAGVKERIFVWNLE